MSVEFPSLDLDICKISQSRWVSVSTSREFFSLNEFWSWQIFRYQSWTKFISLDTLYFSINVSVVSISVLTLRLRPFQSLSRSCHWDSDLFSLGLSLVIETHTFLVSVSSLRLRPFQYWSQSCHWDPDIFSLHLHNPNLVSLIPVSLIISLYKGNKKRRLTGCGCRAGTNSNIHRK